MKTPGLFKVVLPVLLISSGFLLGNRLQAAPVIKDFSSKGGHTTNKAGPKDIMYLVKPGDKITFTVKADGAEKYEWTVNKKVDKEATGESFVWTVPDEKGIWEIHLTATAGKEQAHQEWVISTSPKSEAPDFLEYFVDKKVSGRTETDPWGRKLPEWTYFKPQFGRGSVADGYLKKGPPKEVRVRLNTEFKHTFGTWRIRYMYPHGAMGYRGVGMFFRDGKGGHIKYHVMTEEHDYSGVESYEGKQRQRIRYQIGRRDVCFGPNFWLTDTKANQWHTFMFIHTEDGYFYAFYDGRMMWNSLGWDDRNIRVRQLQIDCNFYPDEPRFAKRGLVKFDRYVDGMEFYEKKYLFPDNGIKYRPYVTRTSIIPGRSFKKPGYYEEIKKNGIVIGRHGATLAEIAAAVGRPDVFTYDPKSKKAICRTNIVVLGGARLVLKGETLLMDSKADAPLEFVLRNGSELNVLDSKIGTTGKGYFRWKIASILDSYVHPGMYPNRALSFDGILVIRNSTIDNCAHMLIEGARKLIIEDSRFTNLVEIEPVNDYSDGGYDGAYGRYEVKLRKMLRGKKAIWFFNRQKMPFFSLKNVLFNGKSAAKPVAIAFIGGDYSGVCDAYNIKFENAYVRTAPSLTYCAITQGESKIIPRTVSLINCNPQKMVAEKKSSVMMKYYLNLKVVDTKGVPVGGAKVTVRNEVDDAGYPSENAVEKRGWAHEYLQKNIDPFFVRCWPANGKGVANHQLLVDANNMRTTVTGRKGRTPPLTDKKHTVILTDFIRNAAGKKEFTYTITVESGGKKKVITGVNPGPDWYRADPNKPTYTITAVLDGKTVTEAQLKK